MAKSYDNLEESEPKEIDTGMEAPEKLDARWLFDYDILWLSFEADLRGGKLKKDPKTRHWVFDIPKGAKPFMNERGIKDIIALMRANVNVISGSSIMEQDRVLQWCRRFQMDLGDLLYINMDLYELDPAKYLAVISTFMIAYEMNLRKSIGGKALMWSLQTERILRTETEDKTQQRSLLKKMFG